MNPGINKLIGELDVVGITIVYAPIAQVLYIGDGHSYPLNSFKVKSDTYVYTFLENMLNMIRGDSTSAN